MKKALENHLGIVLILSMGLGLSMPWVDRLPDEAALVIISAVIFVSCFKIKKTEFLTISIRRCMQFYVMRFVLLPILIWYFAELLFSPFIAIGLLLLTLMPAGIASPAVSTLLGGNTTMALSLVVVTSLLTPLLIPAVFYLLNIQLGKVELGHLFLKLCYIIFIPILIHLPFRFVKQINRSIVSNNGFYSIVLFALLMIVVVAAQRQALFASLSNMYWSIFILCVMYFLYYGLGYAMGFELGSAKAKEQGVTFAICSGVNNNALAITLALSDFSPDVASFLLLSAIPWTGCLVLFKKFPHPT